VKITTSRSPRLIRGLVGSSKMRLSRTHVVGAPCTCTLRTGLNFSAIILAPSNRFRFQTVCIKILGKKIK